MVRYYCEYCHSYLTHDTLSVRKSHLIGKNHLKVASDYYRNKHICLKYGKPSSSSISKQNKNNKNKNNNKHSEGLPSKKIIIHPLSNREKKKNRRIKKIFDKELNHELFKNCRYDRNNIYKQDHILSTLYDGSPGFSKIFIKSNRFDIGDSIKQSRLPQRANQNDTENILNRPISQDLSKRDRNEVYESGDIVSNKIGMLPPPLILSLWANTIPKYQIYYNNNNNNTSHIMVSHSTIKDSKRRYIQSEETGKYKKRKF